MRSVTQRLTAHTELIKKSEENSTGRLFITGYGNMSDVFLSSGKLSVKHEIGPRVIWESSQYTYLWVTYLSLSFLVHMNDETSRLNFPGDLPSSLFHQQTTLETTKICNITQRVQSAKKRRQITRKHWNTTASLFSSVRLALTCIFRTIHDEWLLTNWQRKSEKPALTRVLYVIHS